MTSERGAAVVVGRRERTKQANRQAILDAGRRVFSSVGFDAATIRDVVRESGLSPGTFYNYFRDKDEVFSVLIGDIMAELRPRVRAARSRAQTAEAFVRDAFAEAVEVLYANPANFGLIERSATAFRAYIFNGKELAGIFDELRQDMEVATRLGTLPRFPADLMTAAMVGATLEVCVLGVRAGRSSSELADFLGTLFTGAVGAFAGR